MTYRYDNLIERMHEQAAKSFLTSAVIARVRLLGIVHKDRETAPAWVWRHVGLDFRGDRMSELLIRNRYRYERRV